MNFAPDLMYCQKDTPVGNILRCISENRVKSFLDIDVGALGTALRISRFVKIYLGIKQAIISASDSNSKRLREILPFENLLVKVFHRSARASMY